mmetsp:Transcript_32210/g.65412  ORF Transcript_32210/g.65412 Transcript_32210/m.65412 type:complete len:417 (-) Transcript_32210:711-1961(-)
MGIPNACIACFLVAAASGRAAAFASLALPCPRFAAHQQQRRVHSTSAHTSQKSSPSDAQQAALERQRQQPPQQQQQWAKHALLISSFSDGVVNSPDASSYLKLGLAKSLAAEQSRITEDQVRESVLFSPCAGPSIDLLNDLEDVDNVISSLSQSTAAMDISHMERKADDVLKQLQLSSGDSGPMYCRILYIPTAMYALNPDSKNTPGKQRQRARADGKKRRTQVVNHVQDMLGDNVAVLACTLDFDDGSIKQPVGSNDADLFPSDGEEAFSSWRPHLIYVEGGNTFWLQHCMDKGDWTTDLVSACAGPDAYAVYCGKSAGAIVAGSMVDTATWKGWDDPTVVPGRAAYKDWAGYRGLGFAGEAAVFPHMDDVWEELVGEKKSQLGDGSTVYCLREREACCIDGDTEELFVVSGEHY